MTERAKNMRTLRHDSEREVVERFSRTPSGKRSTIRQVKAAARKILMNLTSKVDGRTNA